MLTDTALRNLKPKSLTYKASDRDGMYVTVSPTGTVTSGAVNDVIEANSLVRASDHDVYADAGYQGAGQRPDARRDVSWHIAMRPGKRRLLDSAKPIEALTQQLERVKAGIRARVEYPFRVLKRQFGHAKVRYRGLVKNTAQLHTLFALVNLWLVRRKLLVALA